MSAPDRRNGEHRNATREATPVSRHRESEAGVLR